MSRISKQQSSSDEPKKTRRQRRSEMSPEKREFLRNFVGMYDIKTAADLQDAVKDLLGDTIKDMLEEEMNEHLGYEKYKHSDNPDSRNGYKSKEIMSSAGSITIDVPQDRDSAFEPKVVKKGHIYGFEVSEGFISDVTDKLLPKIQEWQSRPLEDVYPVVFIDAIHYAVRDEVGVRRKAAYIVLGISASGHKDVLGIYIGENESAKYWLSILNELKNRGVKDILIVCADGLTGIKDAIEAAFPQTEYQRCIVHQVRNTLKYVSDKDRKAFANDLRRIYGAPSEELALGELDRAAEKWQQKYPNSMKSWYKNWDAISPIFKFSSETRRVIYTTNAIESLNSIYRRLNSQRSSFPGDQSLLKALYLATMEATKKWRLPIRDWGKIYGELSIMYEGRLPE